MYLTTTDIIPSPKAVHISYHKNQPLREFYPFHWSSNFAHSSVWSLSLKPLLSLACLLSAWLAVIFQISMINIYFSVRIRLGIFPFLQFLLWVQFAVFSWSLFLIFLINCVSSMDFRWQIFADSAFPKCSKHPLWAQLDVTDSTWLQVNHVSLITSGKSTARCNDSVIYFFARRYCGDLSWWKPHTLCKIKWRFTLVIERWWYVICQCCRSAHFWFRGFRILMALE